MPLTIAELSTHKQVRFFGSPCSINVVLKPPSDRISAATKTFCQHIFMSKILWTNTHPKRRDWCSSYGAQSRHS